MDLIKTEEVAKMLGYTTASFRNMVRREKPFPSYKMAKRVMYNKADVLQYIESRKIDALIM